MKSTNKEQKKIENENNISIIDENRIIEKEKNINEEIFVQDQNPK